MLFNKVNITTLLTVSAVAVNSAPIPLREGSTDEKQDSDLPRTPSTPNESFSIVLVKPGVPYLHMQPVKLTKDAVLVVNGDSSTQSFEAEINADNNLVLTDDAYERVIVDSGDGNSLKVEPAVAPLTAQSSGAKLNSVQLTKTNKAAAVADETSHGSRPQPNSKAVQGPPRRIVYDPEPAPAAAVPKYNPKPAETDAATHLNSDSRASGPWSVTNDDYLRLKNESLSWACPQDKSGVYKVFWTSTKPANQWGCMRVELAISTKSHPKLPDDNLGAA